MNSFTAILLTRRDHGHKSYFCFECEEGNIISILIAQLGQYLRTFFLTLASFLINNMNESGELRTLRVSGREPQVLHSVNDFV